MICTRPTFLTLAWASGRALMSNPYYNVISDADCLLLFTDQTVWESLAQEHKDFALSIQCSVWLYFNPKVIQFVSSSQYLVHFPVSFRDGISCYQLE